MVESLRLQGIHKKVLAMRRSMRSHSTRNIFWSEFQAGWDYPNLLTLLCSVIAWEEIRDPEGQLNGHVNLTVLLTADYLLNGEI